jgi:serine/threonine protein kinase/Tol biopolymer transport system component
MIGKRLAHFEIIGKLGEGGMGVVYDAVDGHLSRHVALKILPQEKVAVPARKLRFIQEAKAASALNHPGIVTIYDISSADGLDYIAMELVSGQNLEEVLARRRLKVVECLKYAIQLADALATAHAAGIVHRDLKPANVMIADNGMVKVLDFGLAKLSDRLNDPTEAAESDKTAVSQDGAVVGTAAYMSPEQGEGQKVDARSDIFSFGAVLYEMLSGEPAFRGASYMATIAAVLNREPPPLNVAGAPIELERIVTRCLRKDVARRSQSMAEIKVALEELKEECESGAVVGMAPSRPNSSSPRRSASRPWVAATVVLGLALIASLWAPWRSPIKEADRSLIQLDLELGEEISQFAISPDGMQLALVIGNRLAMRRLDDAKNTPLEGTDGASFPFFAPDGQWVAFFAGRKLHKISVTGGAPVALCDAPSARGGSWGEDGYIVASLSSSGGLYRVSAAGGSPELLAEVNDEGRGISGYRWPQVLPGGRGVLFTSNNAGGTVGSLLVLTPDRKLKTLVDHSAYGRFMGNHLVYSQRGRLFTAPIDLDRLRLTAPAAPLVDGVASDTARGAIFECSLSGTLIYRRASPGATGILSLLDSAGRSEPIPAPPGAYVSPSVSPDGKRVALALADEAIHNLWIYDLGRRIMSRLTFDAEPQFLPIWTPDGDFVLFRSGSGVAWIRSDGSGKLERLSAPVTDALPGSFAPNGKWLVFAANRPLTGWDIWIAPVDESAGAMTLGTPQPFLEQPGGQYSPAISPDGRWMAYSSDESGRGEVYVTPFSPQGPPRRGKWQVSKDGGIYPRWSRDSSGIFFRSADRHVIFAKCEAKGDSFVPGTPRVWNLRRLDVAAGFPSFDLAPNDRVAGIFEAGPATPETHLRVMLNVNDELQRREKQRAKAGI